MGRRALLCALLVGVLAPLGGVVAAPNHSRLAGGALHAQTAAGARIEIRRQPGPGAVMIQLRDALQDGRFEELLRNGFDVRVHLRAELWRTGRWFDDPVSRYEWDFIVHFDQFDQTFEVARLTDGATVTPLGTYRRFSDAQAALGLPFAPPLARPMTGRRYYYAVQADVETLDLKDLDEVTRWLRGELAPAVQGRKNPGTAFGRGVRTLVSRVLGGEVRRLEARSPRFVAEQ